MLTVSDIMTTRLIKLTPEAYLQDAHDIIRERGIRHLPVVEPMTNRVVALVTQKNLIAHAMKALADDKHVGLSEIAKNTRVIDVATKTFQSIKADQLLVDVAPFFVENKHGCLPVIDDNDCIIGIVTSSDFVKLAVTLLRAK